MNNEITTESVESTGSRRMWLAVVGLVLAVVSPVLWVLTLGNRLMLRTGLAMWVAMAVGLVLAVVAARRDARMRTRVVAVVTGCWVAFSVVGFFVFTRLPESAVFDDTQRVAAFTLPDEQGKPTSLDELAGDGAALLVFYRGHW